jgi:nicotinamide/nicotinate riboside kinase
MNTTFIGLSGPSSSGKSTLAYLHQQIFPNVAFLLHADEFCREFNEIPTVSEYLDCDGPDIIDYDRMAEVLDYLRAHDGAPPPDFRSWQDGVFPGQEVKALATTPLHLIERLKSEVQR